jgi:hypothetical protein
VGLRLDSTLLRGQFVDSLLLAEQRAVGDGL